MKKVIFIILIILVLASLFYSPNITDVKTLGPGCEGQNQRDNNNDGKKGYCFPSNTAGITKQAIGGFPLTFFYEGAKTNGWAVEISSDKLSRVKTAYESAFLTEFPSSTKNCKYYSFSYQRKPTTKTYNFPFVSEEDTSSSDLCWIKELKPLCKACYYSIESFWRDLENIQKLGGEPLSESILQIVATVLINSANVTTFNSICARNSGGGSEDYSICPDRVICELDIPAGKTEIFGITFEKDECGNKKIKANNDGGPISLDEVETRAKDFVDSCSVKYKQQTKCGNGKIDEGEECDDGNKIDEDGCSRECKKENPLCNGIILPATQKAPIKGQANIDLKIEVERDVLVGRSIFNFGGKVTMNIEVDKLVDGKLPKTIRYRIVNEGNAGVVGGIYPLYMKIIAQKSPAFWETLKSVSGQGIIGTGFILEYEPDALTVKEVYALDSSIYETLNSVFKLDKTIGSKRDNWAVFDTLIEIEYEEGNGANVKIEQNLLDNGQVRINKKTTKKLTEEQARNLIFELLNNVESLDNAQKSNDNGKTTNWEPVPDSKDVYEKFKRGELRKGVKISQGEGKMTKRQTVTHSHKLSDILNYLNTCIKKLKGSSATAGQEYYTSIGDLTLVYV